MKLNPRDLQKAMQRLGVQQHEIEAQQVIIKCADKDIIITNPSVAQVNMMGEQSFQISGNVTEQAREVSISADDIAAVVSQTSVDEATARKALEENNQDIARAILSLQKS